MSIPTAAEMSSAIPSIFCEQAHGIWMKSNFNNAAVARIAPQSLTAKTRVEVIMTEKKFEFINPAMAYGAAQWAAGDLADREDDKRFECDEKAGVMHIVEPAAERKTVATMTINEGDGGKAILTFSSTDHRAALILETLRANVASNEGKELSCEIMRE